MSVREFVSRQVIAFLNPKWHFCCRFPGIVFESSRLRIRVSKRRLLLNINYFCSDSWHPSYFLLFSQANNVCRAHLKISYALILFSCNIWDGLRTPKLCYVRQLAAFYIFLTITEMFPKTLPHTSVCISWRVPEKSREE